MYEGYVLTIAVSECVCVCVCVYLVECNILKYVVVAVIGRGVREEVDIPVHATEGVLSLLMQRSCRGSP